MASSRQQPPWELGKESQAGWGHIVGAPGQSVLQAEVGGGRPSWGNLQDKLQEWARRLDTIQKLGKSCSDLSQGRKGSPGLDFVD